MWKPTHNTPTKDELHTGKNQSDGEELENYRDFEYLKNILDNTPPDDTLKKNYEKLILSLMVLQPPLRTSFTGRRLLLPGSKIIMERIILFMLTNKANFFDVHCERLWSISL